MGFEFDKGHLVQNEYVRKAYDAGYLAYEWRGRYCLFSVGSNEDIHEFDTPEELNRMMKLLVGDLNGDNKV